MGLVHFATVGTSPGAVTSALAYWQRHLEQHRRDYSGDPVESVVVFCSHDVYNGERPADEFVWNTYGRTAARPGWQRLRTSPNVIAVIQDFLQDDQYGMRLAGGHLYVWPVDVHDHDQCFEVIAKATLALARAEATGKYVWANLTGGTNILNAALVQVASFSGLIGNLHYIFLSNVDHRKYLLPPSNVEEAYRVDAIPIVKTSFDAAYYRVLQVLQSDNGWWDDDELLNRLKSDDTVWEYFKDVELQPFRTQYLNRMDSREIERERQGDKKLHRVRLLKEGQAIRQRIEQPLFQALVRRGQDVDPELVDACRRELERKRIDMG
jgi:hypothetical protein